MRPPRHVTRRATERRPIARCVAAALRAASQWRGPSYERSRLSDARRRRRAGHSSAGHAERRRLRPLPPGLRAGFPRPYRWARTRRLSGARPGRRRAVRAAFKRRRAAPSARCAPTGERIHEEPRAGSPATAGSDVGRPAPDPRQTLMCTGRSAARPLCAKAEARSKPRRAELAPARKESYARRQGGGLQSESR